MADSFEVKGVKFQQSALKVLTAAALWDKLAMAAGPVLAGLAKVKDTEVEIAEGLALDDVNLQDVIEALQTGAEGLEHVPPLIEAFAPVCKVSREVSGGGYVDLQPFFEETFTRKPTLLIAWLIKCIQNEYGDFLHALGPDRDQEVSR